MYPWYPLRIKLSKVFSMLRHTKSTKSTENLEELVMVVSDKLGVPRPNIDKLSRSPRDRRRYFGAVAVALHKSMEECLTDVRANLALVEERLGRMDHGDSHRAPDNRLARAEFGLAQHALSHYGQGFKVPTAAVDGLDELVKRSHYDKVKFALSNFGQGLRAPTF